MASRSSYPAFSGVGMPQNVAIPVQQFVAQTQSFLRKKHRRDGTLTDLTEWSDVDYHATDYQANGTMVWTVTQAQQDYRRYALIGKTLLYRGSIVLTNVTAPVSTELRIKLPPGLILGGDNAVGYLIYRDAGAGQAVGITLATAGQNYIAFQKLAAANWTATAGNDTTVHFNIVCELA